MSSEDQHEREQRERREEQVQRERRAALERSVAAMSLDELRTALVEKTEYANGLLSRHTSLEGENKRIARERAAFEDKNLELSKKLKVAENDRERAEVLLNMAMEWRGQVIEKIDKLETVVTALVKTKPKKR